MLTDAELQHIAKLARIELKDADVKKYKKDLSSILGYVDQLKSVDTDQVEPLYQTTGLINATRPDKSRREFTMNPKLKELLLGQAPDTKGGYIKVKSVLKK